MTLLRSEHRNGVTILTLADPARRNILSTDLCGALRVALAAAEDDETVKAIVVTGEGQAFCAGAHLGDLERAAAGDTAAVGQVYAAFMAVADSPLPTIAAVNGAAVGAGLNLALACDLRIASDAALFDTRFLKLGLHPGGGCTWMLLRAVGWAAASRMLLLGDAVRGDEALRIGLVERVVASEILVDAAVELGASLATVPRELLLRTKATLRSAAVTDHHSTFARETSEQLWSLSEPGFADSIARLKGSK